MWFLVFEQIRKGHHDEKNKKYAFEVGFSINGLSGKGKKNEAAIDRMTIWGDMSPDKILQASYFGLDMW